MCVTNHMKRTSTTTTERRLKVTPRGDTCVSVPLLHFDDPNRVVFGHWICWHANNVRFVRTPNILVEGNHDLSEGERDMLLRWLSKFPRPSGPILREIATAAQLLTLDYVNVTAPIRHGEISLGFDVKLRAPDNRVFLAYMIATVLSDGYGDNFATCKDCGKWFFDVPSGRPMRKFCHKPCDGNAYRQRQLRIKRKKTKRGRGK